MTDGRRASSYTMGTGMNRKTRLQSVALTQAMIHVKDFMTDSQKALVLLREGKNYMESGDVKGALDCFNQGVCYNPSVTLFNLRASCHKHLDLYKEAYFDYSFNIRLEPEVGLHYCNRGLCLSRLKKAALAMEDMELAIHYDPSAAHYYARATVFADFSRNEDAVADFSVALGKEEVNSLNQEFVIKCRYRRALAFFELKMYDDVVSDAQEVLKLDAASVNARALMGRAFKIQNEHQRAEHQLTEAILLDENQAALYTERGDIRFRTEQKNKIIEAIYDFDRAVTLLETKLGARIGGDANVSASAKFARFNLGTNIQNNGVSTAGSVLFGRANTPGDHGSNSSVSGKSVFSKQPTFRAFSHHSHRDDQHVSTTALYYRDVEEQLADTLYKRAQAKLIVDPNPANITAALDDALKATMLVEEDDDYQLVAATCYIRLNDFQSAIDILDMVLRRSPQNQKALYNMAFCKRAHGSQRDAIEGLSKIIGMKSNHHPEVSSPEKQKTSTELPASIPVHRVYEMRGTLFYEINAHKLALMDLGKAIAINPSNAGNYFLRGDCHCKLGSYEQALSDYNLAESKGFEDMCALLLSRGSVKRLLQHVKGALDDFTSACTLLVKGDHLSRARILSFCAFCQIDLQEYVEAMTVLTEASHLTNAVLSEKLQAFTAPGSPSDTETNMQKAELREDLLYLQRMNWILRYHLALCSYMTKQFQQASEILMECLSDEMQAFVPDDLAQGSVHFFLGQCAQQMNFYAEAKEQFDLCVETHYTDNNHHSFLVHFARAKVLQCLGDHTEALEKFNYCLTLDPKSAHCLFRRAWSQKALGNFVAAGEDFETAKALQPNDPNFAIDYKRIAKCEFMVIHSDPDLVEPFPSLLPVPGLQTSLSKTHPH